MMSHLLFFCFAIVTLLSSPAVAIEFTANYDNLNTERWRCRRCAFEASRTAGAVTLGSLIAAGAKPRSGRDTGIDASGSYVDLAAAFSWQSETGARLTIDATDLGLDSRAAEVQYSAAMPFKITLGWRETPRRVSNDGLTPFSSVKGTASLGLPEDWVRASATTGLTSLGASSRRFAQGSKREQGSLSAQLQLHPLWTLTTAFISETKRGTSGSAADLLFQATALPAPIDYRNRTLAGGLHYAGAGLQVGVDFRRSLFRNANTALEWQNPYAGGPDTGRISLPPANKADSIALSAGWRLGPRTQLNTIISWGRAQQNSALLPYTTDLSLDLEALPAERFAGRIETFAARLNLVSQLSKRARVTLKHRQRERNSASPTLLLTPVLGDLLIGAQRRNRDYDFASAFTELGLSYRLRWGLKLDAGLSRGTDKRSRLEIRRNDEDRAWLGLVIDSVNGLHASLRYELADRDAARFVDTSNNNPLTRRFYQAARDLAAWRAEVGYDLQAIKLSVGLTADARRHRYPETQLGLLSDKDRSIGAHINYTGPGNTVATLTWQRQKARSRTAGSLAFALPDWTYRSRDSVDYLQATLAVPQLFRENFSLIFSYNYSHGSGNYSTFFASERSAFPALISQLQSLELQGRYLWRKRTKLIARVAYENYRSADWAADNLAQDSLRNVLTFGNTSPQHNSLVVGLSVAYSL